MSEVNFNEYKNIWVFAEQRDGKLMNVALELIGEGHNLSRDLGNDAKVAALIIGAICAWFGGNLFMVAASCCLSVFLVELIV